MKMGTIIAYTIRYYHFIHLFIYLFWGLSNVCVSEIVRFVSKKNLGYIAPLPKSKKFGRNLPKTCGKPH